MKNVGGNLDIYDNSLESLGDLQSVGDNVTISRSKLSSLCNLKEIDEILYLHEVHIESLGNLKPVCMIKFDKTDLEDIAKPENVGSIFCGDSECVETLLFRNGVKFLMMKNGKNIYKFY